MKVERIDVGEGQMSDVWIRTHKWCPFGQSLPQPQRALVEVGHLDEDDRFVADSAHLMLDVTDARNPKLEIPIDQLPDERREALRHFGGGWTRSLASMPDWMRQEYSV